MNLDDCNSSSSSSSTSSHSPSSSRSPSPQTTTENQTIGVESREKNSGIEEITSKNGNTDQNDNLINTIENNSSYHQKQLSPIREESYCSEEKILDSPPTSPQLQQYQPLHKQSSSSPPPPSLLSSSPPSASQQHQPLTSMSTDQTLTDPMTPTNQTSSSSPLPQDDSPHPSIHSPSSDDTTTTITPDIENEIINNDNNLLSTPDDNTVDVPMNQLATSPSQTTSAPLSSSPTKLTSTNLIRKRKVSTTDSMMTATATVLPTSTSSAIKSQSTLSDSFVKPTTPESGTTATSISTSTTTIKSSPSPPSPQPPPPLLLPPPLTSKLANVDEKLLKELSQSSLINSLILNSRTPGSILPVIQKPIPHPPPLSLSSELPPTLPTSSSTFSPNKQQQQPIYVAISTNPLILVPLSYNSETGGLNLSDSNNSTNIVKLSNDTLLNSQLNGLIASGIDRSSTLLNNSLEAHRSAVNNNRANLINGIDASNIINVNNLTNNNIISINNNNNCVVNTGDNVNSNRNLNINNIQQQLSQFSSGRPQSTEGPLDLSSNPSTGDPQFHEKLTFRSHHRHSRDKDHHRSTVTSLKVKNEIDPIAENSESPLNLFTTPSTFADLVSAHSADLPQSTASALAAAAAVAAVAAASVSTSPPSSSALNTDGSSLPGPAPSQPTPFTPEAVFKQSSYHCEHCHIGFYKKENYTVHKRYYCSARRSQAAAAAALAAASAGGYHNRSHTNRRTRSESSPDLLESDGSPNSSPEISLDSEKTDRHHSSSSGHQPHLPTGITSSLRKSSTSRRVSISSKTNASNSSTSPGSSPPHQPLSQYYCVACGIRFTSLDNLQAHQTYYCLKRNSVSTSADKLQYIVSIPGGTGSEVSCVKCKATYCNEEAFLSHICSSMNLGAISSTSGSNNSKFSTATSTSTGNGINDGRCSSAGGGATSGGAGAGSGNMSRRERETETDSGQQCFRCTICGYKGQTLQGMRIHVRMHSQCFRCTICGYKGHTLRGMRTHVRIHSDKIQGLPEETFIACIEDEAFVTKSSPRNGPSGPKRRRKSLDAYSGSSNNHNQFTLSSLSNVVISENSKPLSSQLINNLLPSTIPITTSSTSSGTAGILVSAGITSNVNSNSNNNSGTNDELISANNVTNNNNDRNNVNNLNSSHSEISSENDDEATSNMSENEMSGRDDSRQGGSGESVHNCHLCYYSSTYKGNVVRHLKLVHKDNSSSGSSSGGGGGNNNEPFSGLKRDSGDLGNDIDGISGGVGGGGDSLGSIADELPLDLKATRSNGSTERHQRPYNRSPIGKHNYQSSNSPIDHSGNLNNSNGSTSNNNGSSNSSAQAKKAVPKYCRSCDISFQFLTSFIAHKKYYCSSHSNEPNPIQPFPESKSPV